MAKHVFDKKTGQWSTDEAIRVRDLQEAAAKKAAETATLDKTVRDLLALPDAALEYVGERVGKAMKERAALKAPPVAAPPVDEPPPVAAEQGPDEVL